MLDNPNEEIPVDGPAFEQDSTGVFNVLNPESIYDQVDWQMPDPADYVIFA